MSSVYDRSSGARTRKLDISREYQRTIGFTQQPIAPQLIPQLPRQRILVCRGALLKDCLRSLEHDEPIRRAATARLQALDLARQLLARYRGRANTVRRQEEIDAQHRK